MHAKSRPPLRSVLAVSLALLAATTGLASCACGPSTPGADGGTGGDTGGSAGGGSGGGAVGGGSGGGVSAIDAGPNCGDSKVDYTFGEECDDGNFNPGDGCSALCRVEVSAGCGDGALTLSGGEECDDGNTAPGDGCSATCQLEALGATCGNGSLQGVEACDDGNTGNGDGCNPTCNLANVTSLFAGTPGVTGSTDSDAGVVRLGGTGSLAADNTFVYFSDSTNHVVRRIAVATGWTETLAGSPAQGSWLDAPVGTQARFTSPDAIATDGTSVWVIDARRVRTIGLTPPYPVTTLAGAGTQGCVDGTGTAATFDDPRGLTYYRGGLFLVDAVCAVVRRLDVVSKVVTTVAGTAGQTGRVDGVGAAARFMSPRYMASDNSGMLYIADTNGNQVRSLNLATRAVGTFVGSGAQGYVDGVGLQALVHRPRGMASDGTSLYWNEFNQHTVRQAVFTTASTTTLVGQHCDGGTCGGGYVEGTGVGARLDSPWSLAWHQASRSLFFVDSANRVIRRIH